MAMGLSFLMMEKTVTTINGQGEEMGKEGGAEESRSFFSFHFRNPNGKINQIFYTISLTCFVHPILYRPHCYFVCCPYYCYSFLLLHNLQKPWTPLSQSKKKFKQNPDATVNRCVALELAIDCWGSEDLRRLHQIANGKKWSVLRQPVSFVDLQIG
jgi:hypothetical protein